LVRLHGSNGEARCRARLGELQQSGGEFVRRQYASAVRRPCGPIRGFAGNAEAGRLGQCERMAGPFHRLPAAAGDEPGYGRLRQFGQTAKRAGNGRPQQGADASSRGRMAAGPEQLHEPGAGEQPDGDAGQPAELQQQFPDRKHAQPGGRNEVQHGHAGAGECGERPGSERMGCVHELGQLGHRRGGCRRECEEGVWVECRKTHTSCPATYGRRSGRNTPRPAICGSMSGIFCRSVCTTRRKATRRA